MTEPKKLRRKQFYPVGSLIELKNGWTCEVVEGFAGDWCKSCALKLRDKDCEKLRCEASRRKEDGNDVYLKRCR